MKMVVGLGNPIPEYFGTRHNVGADAIHTLARSLGFSWKKKGFSLVSEGTMGGRRVVFTLPQTYMNRSGAVTKELRDSYRPETILFVHDDIDLPLGRMREVYGSSSAGHQGVEDVIQSFGHRNFFRLRLGIGRPVSRDKVVDFVLSPFDKGEEAAVETMKREAADFVRRWIQGETK